MRRRLLLASPLALSGCGLLRRRRHPVAPPRSVVATIGAPYRAGGVWRYPRAQYDYDETGLAVVAGGPAEAADGASWDPTALQAAHPTLQLPAVLRVTNLETGRQILVRLDDRGPEAPGRLLALTPRAAGLLGPGSEAGVLWVRVQIEEGPSRQLTATLGDVDAPPLRIAAAPTTAVQTESLTAPTETPAAVAPAPAVSAVPLRLPELVASVPIATSGLWIDAGGVGRPDTARILQARLAGLGATVVRNPRARPEVAYRVRIGPQASVAAADAMLDRVLKAGIDARIVVD